MRQEVWLDWHNFREKQNQKYSRTGAAAIALNWASGLLAAGLILCAVAVRTRLNNRQLARPILLVWLASIAIGGLIYLALPKVEVRLARNPYGETYNAQRYPLFLVEGETLEKARQILADPTNHVTKENWERHFKRGNWPNNYLGGTIHEEDSPGNFVLRSAGEHVE